MQKAEIIQAIQPISVMLASIGLTESPRSHHAAPFRPISLPTGEDERRPFCKSAYLCAYLNTLVRRSELAKSLTGQAKSGKRAPKHED